MNSTMFVLRQPQLSYTSAATSAVLELDGVEKLVVDASARSLSVTYDALKVSPIELLQALAAAAFPSDVVLPPSERDQSCCGACG